VSLKEKDIFKRGIKLTYSYKWVCDMRGDSEIIRK